MWKLLSDFYETNKDKAEEEEWPKGDIHTNHWKSPTFKINLFEGEKFEGGGDELVDKLYSIAQPIIEEWTGQRLKPVSIYGVRIYKTDSVLSPHVDRHPLISSAIINIDQDIDEDWPLEVIDRDGIAKHISMVPGECNRLCE